MFLITMYEMEQFLSEKNKEVENQIQEAKQNQVPEKEIHQLEKQRKRYKLFSLVPLRRGFQMKYIRINTTCLNEIITNHADKVVNEISIMYKSMMKEKKEQHQQRKKQRKKIPKP